MVIVNDYLKGSWKVWDNWLYSIVLGYLKVNGNMHHDGCYVEWGSLVVANITGSRPLGCPLVNVVKYTNTVPLNYERIEMEHA